MQDLASTIESIRTEAEQRLQASRELIEQSVRNTQEQVRQRMSGAFTPSESTVRYTPPTSTMSDSNGRTPSDLAPAYDDIFSDHPVNANAPPARRKAYAPLSQTDGDSTAHHQSASQSGVPILHYHGLDDPEAQPTGDAATNADREAVALQPSNVTFDPGRPHTHCEECDRMTMKRDRTRAQIECCRLVAVVFIMVFVALMVVGIVALTTSARRAREGA